MVLGSGFLDKGSYGWEGIRGDYVDAFEGCGERGASGGGVGVEGGEVED